MIHRFDDIFGVSLFGGMFGVNLLGDITGIYYFNAAFRLGLIDDTLRGMFV